jgi:hypothetical protein
MRSKPDLQSVNDRDRERRDQHEHDDAAADPVHYISRLGLRFPQCVSSAMDQASVRFGYNVFMTPMRANIGKCLSLKFRHFAFCL